MTNKERADAHREREIEKAMHDLDMSRADAELYVTVVRGRVNDELDENGDIAEPDADEDAG